MNTKRISMVAVMALVLVTTSLASAQEAKGKFTLPCTTYWGSSVLPAGNYTFRIDHATGQGAILRVQGQKNLETAVVMSRDYSLKESALDVHRSSGSAVVTNMHIADGGISISFRAAPAAKELLAGASTSQAEAEKIIVTVD